MSLASDGTAEASNKLHAAVMSRLSGGSILTNRELVVQQILNDDNFLPELLEIFETADDLDNEEALMHLFDTVKAMFLLNNPPLVPLSGNMKFGSLQIKRRAFATATNSSVMLCGRDSDGILATL